MVDPSDLTARSKGGRRRTAALATELANVEEGLAAAFDARAKLLPQHAERLHAHSAEARYRAVRAREVAAKYS